MSLEQQIAALVGRTGNLLDEVGGKMTQIDASVLAKINELNEWRANARNEYPARNMLNNPAFADTNNDNIPDGWAYSSFNYQNTPAGAATLVGSQMISGSEYPYLVGLGGLKNINLLSAIKAWKLDIKNDGPTQVVARVSTNLTYPVPRDYSGGVLMYIHSFDGVALNNAGVGGGNFYGTFSNYNLAKQDEWQWVSGSLPSYLSSFCINFDVKPGGHFHVYLALPMAVDGVCNRVLL